MTAREVVFHDAEACMNDVVRDDLGDVRAMIYGDILRELIVRVVVLDGKVAVLIADLLVS